jgi:hypothetical protein
MISLIRRRLAIRSYAKRLGGQLRKRYGRRKVYTPAQVRRTAEQGGFNLTYLCYAYCIYCDRAAFVDHHRATGEACDFDVMRSEVAGRFFDGDPSFDASDVNERGDGAEFGGDHSSWDHGVGDGDLGGGGDGSD